LLLQVLSDPRRRSLADGMRATDDVGGQGNTPARLLSNWGPRSGASWFLLCGLAGAMPRGRTRGSGGSGSQARPGQLGTDGVEVTLGAFGPGAQLAA
jgi:hypothetical protein